MEAEAWQGRTGAGLNAGFRVQYQAAWPFGFFETLLRAIGSCVQHIIFL